MERETLTCFISWTTQPVLIKFIIQCFKIKLDLEFYAGPLQDAFAEISG
jgi:hypothetical protein